MDFLWQLILPLRCIGCRRYHERGLCKPCEGKLMEKPLLFRLPPLRLGISLGSYDGTLREGVLQLKFKQNKRIGIRLGELLAQRVAGAEWPIRAVVPVPMARQRFRERGYSPVGVIARSLASSLGVPCRTPLVAADVVPHQLGLPQSQRRKNVEGAFRVSGAGTIEKGPLLLLDDVMTTGATLTECASTLANHGVREIYGACLALEEQKRERT